MSADDRPTLLAIQHVPWEMPHRILDACGSLAVHTLKPLAGQALPGHDEMAGAVVMGGPMSVDEVDRHPALRHGNAWGVLFHPEADFALLEAWLAVPEMVREAREAIGDEATAALPAEAEAAEAELVERTTPGLRAFTALVEANRPPLSQSPHPQDR